MAKQKAPNARYEIGFALDKLPWLWDLEVSFRYLYPVFNQPEGGKMQKIGRNDPCPCGSGKKYKKCCLGKNGDAVPVGGASQGVQSELHQAIEGKEFSSLEEAQDFANQFMQQRNQRPMDDFHGLSPEQMSQILNYPFDSPQIAYFPDSIESADQSPIMFLFNLMVEAIGEDGLKPTAKGNLPQKFCREAFQCYQSEDRHRNQLYNRKVNKEDDFFDLHVTRLIAEMAGLVRKYKGRFILSRKCRKLLAEGGGAIYPCLFRTFVEKYNWGYGDRHQEIPFIQHAFLFSLYLLQRYGAENRSAQFYEDIFLNAFPVLLKDIEDEVYMTKEQIFCSAYTLRTFERFAGFLGLADNERSHNTSGSYPFMNHHLTKLPLIDEIVRFNL